MGTVRMVDPTALHARGTPCDTPATGVREQDHVMSWAWSARRAGAEPGGVVLVCAPGVVGMS